MRRQENILATNQPLDVVNGSFRVAGCLVLGGIPDQPLLFSESNVRWRDAVALVVCDDLYVALLVHPDTGIRGTEINPDDYIRLGLLLLFFRYRTKGAACKRKCCTSQHGQGVPELSACERLQAATDLLYTIRAGPSSRSNLCQALQSSAQNVVVTDLGI